MSENHFACPARTVLEMGLAAHVLATGLCSRRENRCCHLQHIFLPGEKQQMRGNGCEGGPLPAPLGCALLPGCTTRCSQGELVSEVGDLASVRGRGLQSFLAQKPATFDFNGGGITCSLELFRIEFYVPVKGKNLFFHIRNATAYIYLIYHQNSHGSTRQSG